MKLKRGQILLITLLVLTVATTIALSLIGRATQDLSISNQLQDSARAFDAAEAGVESALQSGSGAVNVALGNGVTYTVNVSTIGGSAGVFEAGHKTTAGTAETLWLVAHNDTTGLIDGTPFYTDPTLTVCWDNPQAALVIGILYKNSVSGEYQMARAAVDTNAATHANNFSLPTATSGGCGIAGDLSYQLTFSSFGINNAAGGTDTLIALRLRPEYADTTVAADGGSLGVPKQGNEISSVGTTTTGVSRKVLVYQQYRSPASIFDYVIYSQSSFGH